jgi:UDP-2,3-diacylglucosamine pyrophosphatase LpxH
MTFDTVFISDVHLGTPRCNTEKFFKFLKELKTKKLVLVGDIMDIYCMEKYNTRWKKEHTECVHQILNLAKKGTEIVYILGNHEGMIRRYTDFEHKNFKMVEEYVHKDSREISFFVFTEISILNFLLGLGDNSSSIRDMRLLHH